MKAYELINLLMKHDLNKEVVIPDPYDDECIGLVVDYKHGTDVTGVEVTADDKLILLD